MSVKKIKIIIILLAFLASRDFSTWAQTGKVAKSPETVDPLPIGFRAPDVEVKQVNGKSIFISSYMEDKPTVLVFYRGGWCPYCTRQLAGLQDIERDLLRAGFQIIAISPDKPNELEKITQKFSLKYKLLCDENHTASSKYGLAYLVNYKPSKKIDETLEILPVPAVFLIDKKGIIRYRYFNPDYKERLSHEVLLAEAHKMTRD